MEIIYEKANEADAKTILEMQHKLNEMLGLNKDIDEEIFLDYLKQSINSNDTVYYIARLNTEAIGVVSIDFSNSLTVRDVEYSASIPLIFVNKNHRDGKISFKLFKLAIEEIIKRNLNSFAMTIEENNPNKYLHFAIADQLIEEREELLENGNSTKQYLLGVTDINSINNLSYKDILKRVSYTKRNFDSVLNTISTPNNITYKA